MTSTIELDIRIVSGGNIVRESIARPTDDTIEEAARRTGWNEKTKDPDLISDVQRAQKAFREVPEDKPKLRAIKGAELQLAETKLANAPLIDNTQTAAEHVLGVASDTLAGFLFNEQEINEDVDAEFSTRIADEKETRRQNAKAKAAEKLNVTVK